VPSHHGEQLQLGVAGGGLGEEDEDHRHLLAGAWSVTPRHLLCTAGSGVEQSCLVSS
jgi:hypothetical protein